MKRVTSDKNLSPLSERQNKSINVNFITHVFFLDSLKKTLNSCPKFIFTVPRWPTVVPVTSNQLICCQHPNL